MKKLIFINSIFLMLLTLVGCDYPEKSFQALSQNDIPQEVTMDFELPRGVYAEFIWTSDNEAVLEINDKRFVIVYQQDEEIDVTLTARINQSAESFTVKVLKIGSIPTILEQSVIALEKLIIPNEVINPFEIPVKIDNITFEYTKSSYYTNRYEIVTKQDGSIWIVPDLVEIASDTNIVVRAFYQTDEDRLILINSKTFQFRVLVDRDGTNEHRRVFDQLVIKFSEGNHRQYVTNDFILPLTSELNNQATISWTSSDTSTILIDNDGQTAHVTQKEGIWEVTLVVSITIDEIVYKFTYWVYVHPNSD